MHRIFFRVYAVRRYRYNGVYISLLHKIDKIRLKCVVETPEQNIFDAVQGWRFDVLQIE